MKRFLRRQSVNDWSAAAADDDDDDNNCWQIFATDRNQSRGRDVIEKINSNLRN